MEGSDSSPWNVAGASGDATPLGRAVGASGRLVNAGASVRMDGVWRCQERQPCGGRMHQHTNMRGPFHFELKKQDEKSPSKVELIDD